MDIGRAHHMAAPGSRSQCHLCKEWGHLRLNCPQNPDRIRMLTSEEVEDIHMDHAAWLDSQALETAEGQVEDAEESGFLSLLATATGLEPRDFFISDK